MRPELGVGLVPRVPTGDPWRPHTQIQSAQYRIPGYRRNILYIYTFAAKLVDLRPLLPHLTRQSERIPRFHFLDFCF